MTDVTLIILAAGKGTRFGSLTQNMPKPLIPFDGNQTLLNRLLFQSSKLRTSSTRIVTGFLSNKIQDAARSHEGPLTFIHNERYFEDQNAYSLWLAVKDIENPVLLVEGDVVFSDKSISLVAEQLTKPHTTWFTYNTLLPHQIGGVIKSNEENDIVDMQLLKRNEKKFSSYSKNLGAVFFDINGLKFLKNILHSKLETLNLYHYFQLWVDQFDQFPSKEYNLYPHLAGSFNNFEEFNHCRQLFSLPNTELNAIAHAK